MRIQLQQFEIETAIKGYLTRQGIAVTDKNVKMAFTSGRKNNGLSVEVLIEDQTSMPPDPDLTLDTVITDGVGAAPKPADIEGDTKVETPAAVPAEAAAPAAEASEAEAKPAQATSLFGS